MFDEIRTIKDIKVNYHTHFNEFEIIISFEESTILATFFSKDPKIKKFFELFSDVYHEDSFNIFNLKGQQCIMIYENEYCIRIKGYKSINNPKMKFII